DSVHFMMLPNQLPIKVRHADTAQVWFVYRPDTASLTTIQTTNGSWTSPDVSDKFGNPSTRPNKLTGSAISLGAISAQNVTDTIPCVNSATKPIPLTFKFTRTGSQSMVVTRVTHSAMDTNIFYNFHGVLPSGAPFDPTKPPGLESNGDFVFVTGVFVPLLGINSLFVYC